MSGVGGIVSPAGGLPDQHGNRMLELRAGDAKVGRLAARRVELRARLGHVAARRDPLVVPIDGQLQRPLVRRHGRIEEGLLGVEAAQLEVVHRELRPHAQGDGLEIRRGRLRDRAARLDVAADAAPHVRLIREVHRQLVVGHDSPPDRHAEAGSVGGSPRCARRDTGGDGRKEIGARAADRRPGAAKLRLGLGDGLVGDGDLCFQRVQLRVAVRLPPGAAQRIVGRLRRPPRRGGPVDWRLLLERGWHRDRRLAVLGAHRAGGGGDQQGQNGSGS